MSKSSHAQISIYKCKFLFSSFYFAFINVHVIFLTSQNSIRSKLKVIIMMKINKAQNTRQGCDLFDMDVLLVQCMSI